MKAKDVPMPVRVGVTSALVAATGAGALVPKDDTVKIGAAALGVLATGAYGWWAFSEESDASKAALTGLGVIAAATLATHFFCSKVESPSNRLSLNARDTGGLLRDV